MSEIQSRIIDADRGNKLLQHGTLAQLLALRAELTSTKKTIESQLADDTAGLREERADLIAGGMHPREADLRASAGGDHDWRTRATGAQRICDQWLSKIKARIVELSPPGVQKVYSAVSMSGVATSGRSVATAINHLIAKGCKIATFGVVGADLVVISSEPGTT